MSTCSGRPVPLKVVMIGVIISAVAYVIVLSLALSYVPLLLKTSHAISRRMRNLLLVYVTSMATASTVYFIIIVIAFWIRSVSSLTFLECVGFMGDSTTSPNGPLSGLCTVFANWGADGFMLWRCVMLYQGVSKYQRVSYGVLCLVAGLFAGVSLYCVALMFQDTPSFPLMWVTMMSGVLNTVTATLITLRILYFKRYIQKTVGLERNSSYMAIIIICVESSALIIVVSLIYIVLFFRHPDASVIPMQSLVHIYALAPLLIIYRVARGRAATIRQSPADNGTVVSTLHFEPPPGSSSTDNHEA
ncbi:hypothetical protein BYT27DRAFT_6746041 [Phlegmacium glaucopus]|nr:hypothetical protein BYT27DRAFT_6746041 [Phlegmacium glaucopus]